MNILLISIAALVAGLVLSESGALAAGGGQAEPVDPWTRFDSLFQQYGRIYGVPWRWLKAFALTESDLGQVDSVAEGLRNPANVEGSKSSDGLSWGLMQVTMVKANELRPGTTEQDLNDPEISVQLAARYVAALMSRFPGNREYVVRGYNGGPGFLNTPRGVRDTPKYYSRWLSKLNEVMSRQPGGEMEES